MSARSPWPARERDDGDFGATGSSGKKRKKGPRFRSLILLSKKGYGSDAPRETLQDFRYRQVRPTEIRGVHESPLFRTLSGADELLRVFFVVFSAFFSFASDGPDGPNRPIGAFFGFGASTVLTASTFFGTDGSIGTDGFSGLVQSDGSDVRCRNQISPPSPREPRTKRRDGSNPRCSQGPSARHTSHPSHRLVRPVQGR